ncbi:hypothetical protein D9615_002081 [Tricholomella constricta]|uniref:Uncharacterized protein n=1 Tax=Tricholomella constricta TaxID=117010 RepID=A0A8H5HP29_9AGAR|nr:hypothetical protein D9615_002081 [Tricholomella constricta]
MSKRKHEEDTLPLPELTSYNFDQLVAKLKVDGGRDLVAKALVSISTLAGLTDADIKKVSETVPAFAEATWDKVARDFGLDIDKDIYQLNGFNVPLVSLPPSFHKEVMRNAAQWLDVYQDRSCHSREAARVRLMDAWHVPVCALFRGRVVDRPEHPMPVTLNTSGGSIEHEVYMLEGIILIVIELKLYFKNLFDHFAQVMLELDSAFKLNATKEFNNQPPVYAVLTDLRDFYFLRYDGSSFALYNHDISILLRSRATFLDGMRSVTDHLFSIILDGYISNITVIQSRSSLRGSQGDVSKHNSALVGEPKIATPMGSRPSFENWTRALIDATAARDAMQSVDFTSLESWEKTGAHGVSLLQRSVSHLPKIGSITDWTKEQLDLEIDKVLCKCLKVSSDA